MDIKLDHKGASLVGRMAIPDAPGPHAGVLVMHNAHGMGPHMLEIAQRLAELGFAAIATDMYGGGTYHADRKGAGEASAPLWADPQLLRSRVIAWYEHVKTMPEIDPNRIAAIGYCFGGQCVLELARSGADVKAAISYHGLLKTFEPARPGKVKAVVAVFTGTRDPYVPYEDLIGFRNEMIEAGASWQVTEFGAAYHSFTDYRLQEEPAAGQAYHPQSERASWAATLTILDEALSVDRRSR